MTVFEKHVVYGRGKELGKHYNNIMKNSRTEWTLLLDHDVLLAVNKHWFEVSCAALELAKHKKIGLITCRGLCHMGPQRILNAPKNHDILSHIRRARRLWELDGSTVTLVRPPLSGFFMLVNSKAWRKIGGFKEQGFEGVDYDFTHRLYGAGWKLALMNGIYIFHLWKAVKQTKLWQDW